MDINTSPVTKKLLNVVYVVGESIDIGTCMFRPFSGPCILASSFEDGKSLESLVQTYPYTKYLAIFLGSWMRHDR